jgi:hypothetical protein
MTGSPLGSLSLVDGDFGILNGINESLPLPFMITFGQRYAEGAGYIGRFFDEGVSLARGILPTLSDEYDLPEVGRTAESASYIAGYDHTATHILEAVKGGHETDHIDPASI